MFDSFELSRVAFTVAVASPFLLVLMLGGAMILHLRLSERAIARISQVCLSAGLVAALLATVGFLWSGSQPFRLTLVEWHAIEASSFHLSFGLFVDGLSLTFLLLTHLLCVVVGAFSVRYLHREAGFARFFFLYALFSNGMSLAVTAGTIETLFAGWELVGISSVLLIGFFQNREGPVRSALSVWTIYRLADACFLIASIVLHHTTGEGSLVAWTHPLQDAAHHAWVVPVGLLLVLAAAGKSSILPWIPWLPKAMEGPTPSSAVFYGSLSVHLGAFLLLRTWPLIGASGIVAGAVITIGLLTAIGAFGIAQVQTDVKSTLAYSCLCQVGLIFAEIGIGWHAFAMVHLVGHAMLRTLQLLRAPSLLHDYHILEGRMRGSRPAPRSIFYRHLPDRWRVALWRLGHYRGYGDGATQRWIVSPLLQLLRRCEDGEARWMKRLSGDMRTQPASTRETAKPEPQSANTSEVNS